VALILDTGPLYATLDRDDAAYRGCRKLVEEATEPLVIPALVLVEVDYWIHQRLHPGILVALLDDIEAWCVSSGGSAAGGLSACTRVVRPVCRR
jgi:hypothetical protein